MEKVWNSFCCDKVTSMNRNGSSRLDNLYQSSYETDQQSFLHYLLHIFTTYVWSISKQDFNVCFAKLAFIIFPHAVATIVQAYHLGRLNFFNRHTGEVLCPDTSSNDAPASIKTHGLAADGAPARHSQSLDHWLYFGHHKSWWAGFSLIPAVVITWCSICLLLQSTFYTHTSGDVTSVGYPAATGLTYWFSIHTTSILSIVIFWFVRLLVSRHKDIFPPPAPDFYRGPNETGHVVIDGGRFKKLALVRGCDTTTVVTLSDPAPPYLFPWYLGLICFGRSFAESHTTSRLSPRIDPLIALVRLGLFVFVSGAPFLRTCVVDAIATIGAFRSGSGAGIITIPILISRLVETCFILGYYGAMACQLAILIHLSYSYVKKFERHAIASDPDASSGHSSSSVSSGGSTSTDVPRPRSPGSGATLGNGSEEKGRLLNGYLNRERSDIKSYGSLRSNGTTPTRSPSHVVKRPSGLCSALTFSYVGPSLRRIRVYGISASGNHELGDTAFLPLPPSLRSEHTATGTSVVTLLRTCLGVRFLALGILKLANDIVSFACPILFNKLITSLSPTMSVATHDVKYHTSAILIYGMGLAFSVFLSTLLTVHFDFNVGKVSLKAKSRLINFLYGSVLTASISDLSAVKIDGSQTSTKPPPKKFGIQSAIIRFFRKDDFESLTNQEEGNGIASSDKKLGSTNESLHQDSSVQGSILSMLSTDVDRIVNFCGSFHSCWSLPLQIMVSLYLLYVQVGMTFLVGLALVIAMIPVNRWLALRISTYSSGLMKYKDQRLRLLTHMITGWRSVKMLGLERYFVDRVEEARHTELTFVRRQKYLDALCVYFWATTPVLMSVSTFVTYVILQQKSHSLDAAKIFTSLALFNMLISPLNSFPWVVNGLVEAWISLKRVRSLLDGIADGSPRGPDLPTQTPSTDRMATNPLAPITKNILTLEDCHFSWCRSSARTPENGESRNRHSMSLSDLVGIDLRLDLTLPALIGLTGNIGSGKSSLMLALMNEMTLVGGRYYMAAGLDDGRTDEVDIRPGSLRISYSGQKSWIRSGTIRDNILFGSDYDTLRYARVLEALKLDEDIESMPAKDMTMVGESGNSLSGGQQTRLSLARAIYRDADLYLLDEPLASLDNQVGSWVFHQAIKCFLRHKIVILASHVTRFFEETDQLWLMSQGRLTLQRSYVRPSLSVEDDNRSSVSQANHGNLLDDATVLFSLLDPLPVMEYPETSSPNRNRSLDSAIVLYYIKSMGYTLFAVILVSFTLMQITRNGCDWWLAYFHFDNVNQTVPNATAPRESRVLGPTFSSYQGLAGPLNYAARDYYLAAQTLPYDPRGWNILEFFPERKNKSSPYSAYQTSKVLGGQAYFESLKSVHDPLRLFLVVYVILGLSNSIFTLIRSFLFAYGGVRAAKKCHQTLFNALVRAKPSNFYSESSTRRSGDFISERSDGIFSNGSNPSKYGRTNEENPESRSSLLGRLINRFSSDTYTIDTGLPFMANILVAQLFGLAGTLFVGCWAQPWLAPLILPLAIIFYLDIQSYYRTASREIKRLEAASRAPVLATFAESLAGKEYVRNFAAPVPTNRPNYDRVNVLENICSKNNIMTRGADSCYQDDWSIEISRNQSSPPLTSHPTSTVLDRFEREYSVIIDDYVRASFNNLALGQWLNLRLQLFGVAFIAALVCLIAVQVRLEAVIIPSGGGSKAGGDQKYKPYSGMASTSSGMIGLALSYFLAITSKLSGLVTVFVETEKELISVERIKECADAMLPENSDEKSGDESSPADYDTSPDDTSVYGQIHFNNVSVCYAPEDLLPTLKPQPKSFAGEGISTTDRESDQSSSNEDYPFHLALRDITFTINPGEKIGIVGRTGAGKSSLFSALLRMVDPLEVSYSGVGSPNSHSSILVNGKNITEIPPEYLRNKIMSVVPQTPFLIPGTLRLNLDPLGTVNDSTIYERLQLAGLYQKVIVDMGGLDRPIMSDYKVNTDAPTSSSSSDNGNESKFVELSHGQQQVLSLARVVVNKNKIILIDEPTSNVDKETQDLLSECIFQRAFSSCTVLVIAHRLETLRSCDRIMVLGKGKLLEMDTPLELISDPHSKFSSFAKGVWSL